MNVFRICLMLSFVNFAQGAPEAKFSQKIMQDVRAIPDDAIVWLLVPTKPDWTQFDFSKIESRYSKPFIEKLKRSHYHSKASDYALTEPVNADKKSLQGLFVVILKGKILGFRKKATMIKKNTLGIVEISQFDPETCRMMPVGRQRQQSRCQGYWSQLGEFGQ